MLDASLVSVPVLADMGVLNAIKSVVMKIHDEDE